MYTAAKNLMMLSKETRLGLKITGTHVHVQCIMHIHVHVYIHDIVHIHACTKLIHTYVHYYVPI